MTRLYTLSNAPIKYLVDYVLARPSSMPAAIVENARILDSNRRARRENCKWCLEHIDLIREARRHLRGIRKEPGYAQFRHSRQLQVLRQLILEQSPPSTISLASQVTELSNALIRRRKLAGESLYPAMLLRAGLMLLETIELNRIHRFLRCVVQREKDYSLVDVGYLSYLPSSYIAEILAWRLLHPDLPKFEKVVKRLSSVSTSSCNLV